MAEDVLLYREPPLATVTFNRPDQRNAISFSMWEELAPMLAELDADGEIRAIIFAGAGGKAFSAGATSKTSRNIAPTPKREKRITTQ